VLPIKIAIPVVVLVSLSAACARKDSSLASDTSGSEDVANTESDIETLGTSFIGSDGQSVTTSSFDVGAGDIRLADDSTSAGNPGFFFQPAGCEVTTVDKTNAQASYAFSGCTGPLGLVSLTGTVNLTWSTTNGQLTLNYSAQNFQINRATIDTWQATAVVTANGTAREMTWNAMLSGTTGEGRSFSRTNQKVVDWVAGIPCIAVTGQSTGDILKVDLQTTVVKWNRCADSCPQAGSEIQVKNLTNGDELTINYLGGPEADLEADGRTLEIGLACGL
jgi:hypothetical protein